MLDIQQNASFSGVEKVIFVCLYHSQTLYTDTTRYRNCSAVDRNSLLVGFFNYFRILKKLFEKPFVFCSFSTKVLSYCIGEVYCFRLLMYYDTMISLTCSLALCRHDCYGNQRNRHRNASEIFS